MAEPRNPRSLGALSQIPIKRVPRAMALGGEREGQRLSQARPPNGTMRS